MNAMHWIGHFSTEWIKYNDYEMKEDHAGHLYLVPTQEARYTLYNPFEQSELLLLDTLKLGDAYRHFLSQKTEKSWDGLKRSLLKYVRSYGLMGLVGASTYNRDIIGDKEVLLMEKNGLGIKERLLPSEAYIKLFTPFVEKGDLTLRTYKNSVDLIKAEDSPKFYGKRPLVMDLIFSRFYAERADWYLAFAAMLTEHFDQMAIYKNSPYGLTEPVTIMAGQFQASKIGFSIQRSEKTQISWDFDSLKTTIQTIYAFAVSDESQYLVRCEHCHGFFFAGSDREKYCSPVCRNRFNVRKSREKKKAASEVSP